MNFYTKLKLNQLLQAQTTGVLLEIDEPIEQITKKIRNLDKVQLKALEQSFDYLTNPTNFSNQGEIKLIPTAVPLLPFGVEVMHLLFGVTVAYFVGQAATETAKKLQEHKKTTADSKTKDQNATSFQAHPTEPNIFATPAADVDPTKTVFPMDQTNPSPHVFVPADVDSKIEGYPDQSSEFNRPTLLFSKKKEEGNATSKLYTKNPDHGYVKVPEEFKNRTKGSLPGFEDSKYIGIKNGRSRWILPDKKIVEWDYQHGEVELYSKNGKKHLGAYDPYTGRQIKQAKPDRNVEP